MRSTPKRKHHNAKETEDNFSQQAALLNALRNEREEQHKKPRLEEEEEEQQFTDADSDIPGSVVGASSLDESASDTPYEMTSLIEILLPREMLHHAMTFLSFAELSTLYLVNHHLAELARFAKKDAVLRQVAYERATSNKPLRFPLHRNMALTSLPKNYTTLHQLLLSDVALRYRNPQRLDISSAHEALVSNPCQFVLYAAQYGHLTILNYFRDEFHTDDVTLKSRLGRTPLMYAAAAGNMRAVRYLVQNFGVDVDELDKSHETALFYALRYSENPDSMAIANFLSKASSPEGNSLLFWLLKKRPININIPIINYLLNAGMIPDLDCWQIATRGQRKLMLSHHASTQREFRASKVTFAISVDKIALLKSLLSLKEVEIAHLSIAAQYDSVASIRFLMYAFKERLSALQLIDCIETALKTATHHGQLRAIKLLLAELSERSDFSPTKYITLLQTLFSIAIEQKGKNCKECAQYLFQQLQAKQALDFVHVLIDLRDKNFLTLLDIKRVYKRIIREIFADKLLVFVHRVVKIINVSDSRFNHFWIKQLIKLDNDPHSLKACLEIALDNAIAKKNVSFIRFVLAVFMNRNFTLSLDRCNEIKQILIEASPFDSSTLYEFIEKNLANVCLTNNMPAMSAHLNQETAWESMPLEALPFQEEEGEDSSCYPHAAISAQTTASSITFFSPQQQRPVVPRQTPLPPFFLQPAATPTLTPAQQEPLAVVRYHFAE